jgi:hypothetical protein
MAGLRLTLADLEQRRLLPPERLATLKQEMAAAQAAHSALGSGNPNKAQGSRSQGGVRRQAALEVVDSKKISRPHRLVWEAVQSRWPGRAVLEYTEAVPGRAFRLDIAFPHEAYPLAVEVDGWRHHGRHLADFKKDRRRQNDLCLAGWRILRFFPGEIYLDIEGVTEQIARALDI